uniref:DNA mismatch repair proteins mutS family domain-containing protein n=1 Tax=Spongospora subterranea TaxID=70186 RepID=A0A0H5QSZ2_9EUKA|eukprot:CRZ04681.1 hypothetical protein [Spongospora subterranea]
MDALSTPFESSGGGSIYRISINETPTSGIREVSPNDANLRTPETLRFNTPKGNLGPFRTPHCLGKRSRSTPSGNAVSLKAKYKKYPCPQTPRRVFNASTPAPKSAFVVALSESRNKRQVGAAILNLRSPELDLFLYTDNQTYQSTLRLVHLYEPVEVLISDTAVGSNLYMILNAELDMYKITAYQRKHFNEDQGQLLLEQKASRESLNELPLDSSLFLCMASTNCLLKWVAFEQCEAFAPNSIKVSLKTLDGHMALNLATIKTLEILCNAVNPKAKKGSLFSVLNLCKTPLGERLLRSSLIQPLNHIPTINARLDSVQELLENDETFFELLPLLPQFSSLDLMNNGLAMVSRTVSEKSAQQSVTDLLLVKHALSLFPRVVSALSTCNSTILKSIAETLDDQKRELIMEEISQYITEDAQLPEKSCAQVLHTRLAFAVKPGLNGLLDVGRATYCEIIEAINEEIQKYVVELELPKIKKHFTSSRGFFLSLPIDSLNELPDIFIQRSRQGKRITFSTANLISLDDRRTESLGDVLLLTERCLQELSSSIRMHLPWLLNVTESIAVLDLLVNFANLVTQHDSYIRPILTKDGPIAISKGRHPVKEAACAYGFTPNDIYLNETSKLQVVTGPNGSGKSTYLRQTGLLVIMSHIGSFIPAAYASVPVIDQIFSRMSHGDDLEGNASGFFVEARDAAFIVRNTTNSSLVLIDELGRSTSTVDGIGIAWSVIEEIISKGSYCLFATHFHELTDLPRLYQQIHNIQLKVDQVDQKVDFCYSIADGSCQEVTNQYGIYIAELAMFPQNIISFARILSAQLRRRFNVSSASHPTTACFYDTIQKLISLRHCTLPQQELISYLRRIREEMLPDDQGELPTSQNS